MSASRTVADDLLSTTVVNNTAPLMTSSISLMIGAAERSAAATTSEAAFMPLAAATGIRPQISVTGDGSLILTMSCPPMAANTASAVNNSVSDSIDSVNVISSRSDHLSDSSVHSSSAVRPDSSVTHRFDLYWL